MLLQNYFPSSFHFFFGLYEGFQFAELNRTENSRSWACEPGHSSLYWRSDTGDGMSFSHCLPTGHHGGGQSKCPHVKVLRRVMELSTGHMGAASETAAITSCIVTVLP